MFVHPPTTTLEMENDREYKFKWKHADMYDHVLFGFLLFVFLF